MFFDTFTVGLFLTYTDEEYVKQKEKALSAYTFYNDFDLDVLDNLDSYIKKYFTIV